MTSRAQLYRAGGLATKVAQAQQHLDQLETLLEEIEIEMRRLTIRVTAIQAINEADQ